jgi:hypothetical protein
LRQSQATVEDYWTTIFNCVEIDRYEVRVER